MTFLTYPGGKMSLAPRIVSFMGPHRIYVEPFSGTASVLMAKSRASFELLNDADGRLVTLLRVVRDHPDELARALELTPYARSEYRDCDPNEDGIADVERARRVCIRLGQSFAKSGLVAATKGWRVTTGAGSGGARTWAALPQRILDACERLRGVHIDCGDALALIERYGNDEDAVLYVDPPYLAGTRVDAIYAHEFATDEQHAALAGALARCRAHVLLSGYHSPLYDDAFAEWPRVEISAVANHSGNSAADPRRVEVLWSNRHLVAQVSMFEDAA